jgi:hypothetical protein
MATRTGRLSCHFIALAASSFLVIMRGTLTRHSTSTPVPREGKRVLRTLRPRLRTQTIAVRPVQSRRDATLVPAHEPGHFARGGDLQCRGGPASAPAAGSGAALSHTVQGLAVVRPESGAVRLDSTRFELTRVGLPCVESRAAKDQGMVDAKAADFFAGGSRGADAAVVDPRGTAARRISCFDWKISGYALPSRMGRRGRGGRTPVHQRRNAGPLVGTREGVESGEPRPFIAGPGDDAAGLVFHIGRFIPVRPLPLQFIFLQRFKFMHR